MNRMTKLMIHELALRYDFDENEAIRYLFEEEIETNHPPPKRNTASSKKIPLPWLGVIDEDKCQALVLNYGLYTQCTRDPMSRLSYCDKCCDSQEYGTVKDRKDPCFNGKGKKPVVLYGRVLKNRNISREEAVAYAESVGIVIPEIHFEVDKRKLKKKQKQTQKNHDPNVELEEEIDDEFPDESRKPPPEDSDDEYEEITCKPIVYKDITYLLDMCTNNVYSKEEDNPFVGKYDDETKEIDFNTQEG